MPRSSLGKISRTLRIWMECSPVGIPNDGCMTRKAGRMRTSGQNQMATNILLTVVTQKIRDASPFLTLLHVTVMTRCTSAMRVSDPEAALCPLHARDGGTHVRNAEGSVSENR